MAYTGVLIDHLRASRNPDASLVYHDDFVMLPYDFGTSGGGGETHTLTIPASPENPVIVEEVLHYMTTASTAGSTASVTVGDGSDVDYWIPSGVVIATKGTGIKSAVTLSKFYDSATQVVATVINANATGSGLLLVRLVHLKP